MNNMGEKKILYENVSMLQKVIEKIIIPLIIKTKIGLWLFTKISHHGALIKENAGSYKSLDIIYSYKRQDTKGENFWSRFYTHLLLNFINAKAVRNRKLVIEKELKKIISSIEKKEINIASLGAGSGEAIIQAMQEFNGNGKIIKSVLVDLSEDALDYSRKLAFNADVVNSMEWICGDLRTFIKNGRKGNFQIVEMAGIGDYFEDKTLQKLILSIYKFLPPGGSFISCNVAPNIEKTFLDKILNWKMVYRSKKELEEIMEQTEFDFKVFPEPLGVHYIIVAQKPNNP